MGSLFLAYDDTIKSGDGDDTNVGDSDGGEGDDVIKSDMVTTRVADDTINSGKGDDINDGGNGNDKIKTSDNTSWKGRIC